MLLLFCLEVLTSFTPNIATFVPKLFSVPQCHIGVTLWHHGAFHVQNAVSPVNVISPPHFGHVR